MAYVKLDCGIVKSTLWMDREAREVFITALLMAEPTTIEKPTPQLEVRNLNETGWMIQPGAYGFVDAAGVGIIGFARIDMEAGMAALERLGSPELSSRSQAHDGRRLARIDGGYLVLNFAAYRDKDHTAKDRMRRFRERQKEARHAVTSRNGDVTQRVVTDSIGQKAEAYAKAEQESEGAHTPPTDLNGQSRRTKTERACRLPPDFTLTDDRREVAVAEQLDPDRTFAKFCDYWRAAAGAKARKLDWDATWRNWCRTDADRGGRTMANRQRAKTTEELEAEERNRGFQ